MWETRLTDCITVWPTSTDGFGGHSFDTPRVIKGRWQDSQEKFVLKSGQETVSRAVVFLSEDVSVGDWIVLGEHYTGDPIALGAIEVRMFGRSADLRHMTTLRKATL